MFHKITFNSASIRTDCTSKWFQSSVKEHVFISYKFSLTMFTMSFHVFHKITFTSTSIRTDCTSEWFQSRMKEHVFISYEFFINYVYYEFSCVSQDYI